MKKWTENNIPDLTGKVIVITGGNSGLGFEAAKMFAEKNAEVVLTSRSIEKGETARRSILLKSPVANINVMQLDLADLKSVHQFADSFKSEYSKLDVLLNNAGIMWCPYAITKDGFESQMGTNHFGHFALTGLLLELIRNTSNSRVVNVSSLGHKRAKWNPEKVMMDKNDYDQSVAYFNSKLANLLFTYELQRKFEKAGINAISVAAHPGGSNTNLARYVEKNIWFRLLKPVFLVLAQSAKMGTLPQVRASVEPEVKGGEYLGPRGFNEMGGYPVLVKSTPDSHNLGYAEKLWELSEKLTGVTFNFN